MLKAIRNHIIFQFIDEVRLHHGERNEGGFVETTDWGFRIQQNHERDTTLARQAIVFAVGHEAADDFQVGDVIIIEPLMWSGNFSYQGEIFWRTDATKVIGFDVEATEMSRKIRAESKSIT